LPECRNRGWNSIDVAVLGILLGRIAGLPRSRLRNLALGCRRRNVGKKNIDANSGSK